MSADNETALQSSLTDMMTSLMVIFVLLLVNYLREAQGEKQEQARKTTDQVKELEMELSENIEKDFRDITVTRNDEDPLAITMVIPETLLFDKNKATLSDTARSFIADFTPKFIGVLCEPDVKDNIRSVIIQGHTDSDRPADRPFYNIELSQRRALAVFMAMLETDDYVGRECLLELTSVSGRGERDIVLVDGVEDKEKSRRVVFQINLRSQAEEQFENLLKNASPFIGIRPSRGRGEF